ncbi:hypothetical protein J6590_038861 [Homalodisca vitripennis]|nr:hypothetical protein J6590_038861 [Homalodisca vitripennis]
MRLTVNIHGSGAAGQREPRGEVGGDAGVEPGVVMRIDSPEHEGGPHLEFPRGVGDLGAVLLPGVDQPRGDAGLTVHPGRTTRYPRHVLGVPREKERVPLAPHWPCKHTMRTVLPDLRIYVAGSTEHSMCCVNLRITRKKGVVAIKEIIPATELVKSNLVYCKTYGYYSQRVCLLFLLTVRIENGLFWPNLPHLGFGIKLWGICAKHKLERVFRLHKRSVRMILGLRTRESRRDAFRELGLLTLSCVYILEVILYSRSKCALVLGGDVHHHGIRARDNFRVQEHRTNAFRNLPSQVGVRLINIPTHSHNIYGTIRTVYHVPVCMLHSRRYAAFPTMCRVTDCTQCSRRYAVFQTVRSVPDNVPRYRLYAVFPTVCRVPDCTQCSRLYAALQTVRSVPDGMPCSRLYAVFPSICRVTDCTQCSRRYAVFQTVRSVPVYMPRYRLYAVFPTVCRVPDNVPRYRQYAMSPSICRVPACTQCSRQYAVFQTVRSSRRYAVFLTICRVPDSTQCSRQYAALQTVRNVPVNLPRYRQYAVFPTLCRVPDYMPRSRQYAMFPSICRVPDSTQFPTVCRVPDYMPRSRQYAMFLSIGRVTDSTQCSRRYAVFPTICRVPDSTQCSRPYAVFPTICRVPDSTQCSRQYAAFQTVRNVPVNMPRSRKYAVVPTIEDKASSFLHPPPVSDLAAGGTSRNLKRAKITPRSNGSPLTTEYTVTER